MSDTPTSSPVEPQQTGGPQGCTLLIYYDKGVPPTQQELQKRIENACAANQRNSDKLIAVLEELLLLMINGESYPRLLMTMIRFVVPKQDHRVKKLLMIYWELCEKTNDDGSLKEEMILVVNALRNDLMHPNEYVRGSTLRLLCKLKYYRILEPLTEAILRNLTHRHSYVRRNAVMYAIVSTFGEEMMPTASQEVENLLLVEGDLSTKRNAFLMLMLTPHNEEKAMSYIFSMQDQVANLGDICQLVILELIRRVNKHHPEMKGALLKVVYTLRESLSPAVQYETANTLVILSKSHVAIGAAAEAYVNLVITQADNNVKLIVLDRIDLLRKHYKQAMEPLVMDLLRGLSCPAVEVRRKILHICTPLVNSRNIADVVGMLRKELIKTQDTSTSEGNTEYRRLLIRALHLTTIRVGDATFASQVVSVLLDILTEQTDVKATDSAAVAADIVMFVRETIIRHEQLRESILTRLAESLNEIRQSRVIRGCLWLLGEFSPDCGKELSQSVLEEIVDCVSPLPIKPKATEAEKDEKAKGPVETGTKVTTRTVVLADGTYANETVYDGGAAAEEDRNDKESKTPMRKLIAEGDSLLATMVGVTATKLLVKGGVLHSCPVVVKNQICFLLANLVRLCENLSKQEGASDIENASGGAVNGRVTDTDAVSRLTQCIRAIVAPNKSIERSFKREWGSGNQARNALKQVLELEAGEDPAKAEESAMRSASKQPDDLVFFRQLKPGATVDDDGDDAGCDLFESDDASMLTASTADGSPTSELETGALFAERLDKVLPMTGLADPVYVEGFLRVHSFDLVLELNVFNRTNTTLQNIQVELSTQGDLKIVERPQCVTLAPGAHAVLYATIKVSSTETGVIYGYVAYDMKSADDKESLVLNELHVDILDYIERAWVNELNFRTMWSEFEWENKINITNTSVEPREFLANLMENTNMSIVGRREVRANVKTGEETHTAKKALVKAEVTRELNESSSLSKLLGPQSKFVAVNLYARSIFGEDALANVSLEKNPDGSLSGSVRIRSRTQGIALSLGDRITLIQRKQQQKQSQKKSSAKRSEAKKPIPEAPQLL